MTDSAQFGAHRLGARTSAFDCAALESWLAESAERTLPSGIEEKIRRHARECAACNEKLAQTRKGREWLLVLKQEALEPPNDLVAKILAQTSLAQTSQSKTSLAKAPADTNAAPEREWRIPGFSSRERKRFPASLDHDFAASGPLPHTEYDLAAKSAESSVPLWQRTPVVVLRRTVLEPRLALVAAMAFFSISLTLNLMGIQLGGLRASDLSPNGVRRMITRQYADANARVVRYYENLRVVYEVEARVQQVRRASEAQSSPEPPKKPRKQSFNFHPHTHGNTMEREGRQADYRTIEKELQMSPVVSGLVPAHTGIVVEAEMRQILNQERRWA